MRRPPRPRDEPLLPVPLLVRIGLAGAFTAVAALVLIELRGGDAEHARWLAYSVLVIGQVVRAFANRTLSLSLLRLRLNGFLALAVLLVAAIHAAIPYVPPLADAFHASPLAAWEWGVVFAIALAPALAAELIRRSGRTWVA